MPYGGAAAQAARLQGLRAHMQAHWAGHVPGVWAHTQYPLLQGLLPSGCFGIHRYMACWPVIKLGELPMHWPVSCMPAALNGQYMQH